MSSNVCFGGSLSLIAIISITLLAAACGLDQQSNVEYGIEHQMLFVANGDDPASLDPHLATGLSERNILQALFEGLVGIDAETGNAVPTVANHWEINKDQTVYTFYLNDKARWSNGDSVTAQDFAFSWQRVLDPQIAASYAYMLYPIKNARAYHQREVANFSEVGVTIVDDRKLTVTLERATPWFLQALNHPALFPVHRGTLEKFKAEYPELSQWTKPQNMVSNGPFQLQDWQINNNITVTVNPYYWNIDKIRLKGIVFQHISDKGAEERAFRSAQVHATNTPRIAIEKLNRYKNEQPEVLIRTPLYASIYYAFNTEREPFNAVDVRRALALAINREVLVKQVLKGGESPNYSFIPANPDGYSPLHYFDFNPDKARALLAAAGYHNGRGFPPFELQIVSRETNLNIAVAIQAMWREHLNIEMTIHQQEWKSWLQTRAAKNFELCTGSWYADYVDASNFFDVLRSDSGNNHTGWRNPEYDRLLDNAALISDSGERIALLEQANRILAEEMPVIPLFQPVNSNLVDTRVKGWAPSPTGMLRYQDIELVKSKLLN